MERMPELAGLDLNLLVALDRLLTHPTLSAAAASLSLSQPAMSRTLERLRRALQDPLFVRVGRGLVPTARAQELRQPVQAALAAAHAVFAPPEPFVPARARGAFRIALGDEAQAAFADAILTALWRECPGIDVRLHGLRAESADEARRGELELAFGPDLQKLPRTAGAVDLADFVFRRLYDRRWVVISAARKPRRRLGLAAYAAAPHLVVGPAASGRGFIDDLLAERNLTRRVAATVSSFLAAPRIVERTELVCTLPIEVVRRADAKVVWTRAPLPIPAVPMGLIWHPRLTSDPRHRFLRELVGRVIVRAARVRPS